MQSGFDTLRALLPSLNTGDPQTDSCKISKAALLTKGGDYLKELKDARAQNTLEIKDRKECIARLQSEIKSLQGELPYSGKDRRKGSSLGDSAAGDTRQLFLDYTRECAIKNNWKYWVFAQLVLPLAESYDRTLGLVDFEHTAKNALVWMEQSCGLPQMRTTVSDQLLKISLDTEILGEPDNFAYEMVSRAANVAQLRVKPSSLVDYEEQIDETDRDSPLN